MRRTPSGARLPCSMPNQEMISLPSDQISETQMFL